MYIKRDIINGYEKAYILLLLLKHAVSLLLLTVSSYDIIDTPMIFDVGLRLPEEFARMKTLNYIKTLPSLSFCSAR